MNTYEPITVFPFEFQRDWQAQLVRGYPTSRGIFHLVNIRRSAGAYEEQRITVLVMDENGFPLSGVPVAFSYSTANRFIVPETALWLPPTQRAFIVPTGGSGQIDQIQGSVVKAGEPGGVSVFCWQPEFSSDIVTGAGMLADHTGMHLTFQLQRTGVVPLAERISAIEARLTALEGKAPAIQTY